MGRDIGLDSLNCGKWRKISKSSRDLDLDQMMPSDELSPHTTIYSSFNLTDPLFFQYRVHRHSDTQTDTQTGRREFSTVAVRPSLKKYLLGVTLPVVI